MREFLKNQIREAVQDKAIDGLAQALGADPATAHQAKDLVLAFKDARKGGHRPASAPSVPLPAPTEGLRVRTEPNVSEATVKRLKQISLQVKKAPVVGAPPWRLQEFLNKLPETERAVYELRAAMVEASEEISRPAVLPGSERRPLELLQIHQGGKVLDRRGRAASQRRQAHLCFEQRRSQGPRNGETGCQEVRGRGDHRGSAVGERTPRREQDPVGIRSGQGRSDAGHLL